MSVSLLTPGFVPCPSVQFCKKAAKRLIPLALAIYFIPTIFAVYVGFGLLDFLRHKRRTFSTLDRYFAGNGFFTWLLSPFNLLMDAIALPYRNKGIYQLNDLPKAYQDEIIALIEAAHRSNLVGKLEAKMDGAKRVMIFFKWYGKNVRTFIDVPEFHRPYKYLRTIGLSIFNTKQSTGKHFGPLRVTLRVLYNINDIQSDNVYIKVGNRINYWRENRVRQNFLATLRLYL
jgi:hypothetical protein